MRIAILLFLLAATVFALPIKVYLPVQFLCQAPNGDWSQPWQDACEEAAIVMGVRRGSSQEILSLINYQKKHYGGHHDLNAKQIAQLIKDYYKYNNVKVLEDVTVEKIKQQLARGRVVIAPMAGRLLKNLYYTPPGPLYHCLLIKGYDDRSGEFITNDPGTRRGRNYRYKYKRLFKALADYPVEKNKKTIVVLGRS